MNKSVLLIEDNEQNRYLTTFLLEQKGYVVTHAWDGFHGIELAKKITPTVILLDIQLPTMDGHSIAKTLRSIEAVKDIKIIAVTSYAMQGDREKALAAGCNGYIEKPIDPETFVSEIEKICNF